MNHYDTIILGSGAAAKIGTALAEEGEKVAIIDDQPFGGTCPLRGCMPKKVLVDAARALHTVRRMEGKGIARESGKIDWPDLQKFKQTFTEDVTEKVLKKYETSGAEAIRGTARFVDEQTIEVDGRTLRFERIVLGVGARPAELGIEGEDLLTTSDAFLELEELPQRIVFVGGGYISLEFAHLAAIAGAEVTILHQEDRLLEQFSAPIVEVLTQRTRDHGIRVELGAEVTAIRKEKEGIVVETQQGSTVAADLVVHGAGRISNGDRLDLDAAGIEHRKGRILVNDHLRSLSNDRVYALGDCIADHGPPLTPVASKQGAVVRANLLAGTDVETFDHRAVPSVAFTIPPIASLGRRSEELDEEGIDYERHFRNCADWFSSKHLNEPCSAHEVLVDTRSGQLLGVHLVGPYAAEQINLFALAMRNGLGVEELTGTIWAYPTGGSDVTGMVG